MKGLNASTDVPGIKVGHASDLKALICYTVIFGEQSLIESVKRAMTKDGFDVVPAYLEMIALRR